MRNMKNQVKIRLFSRERGSIVTLDMDKLLCQFSFVEELVNHLLDSYSVTSVFRSLFAIRVYENPPLWLSPNTLIKELCSTKLNNTDKELIYELRMRFRPSYTHGFTNMYHLDQNAFTLIFNQIRYDFLYTIFDHVRSEDLFTHIWIMMVIDLTRQSLNKGVSVERFLELNPNRAIKIPKIMNILVKGMTKAQNWMTKNLLGKSVEECLRKLGKHDSVMFMYIVIFLTEVCTSYASECYRVECLNGQDSNMILDVRISYQDFNDQTNCIIETKPLAEDSRWAYLCDMQTICYGTFHFGVVELDRSNGSPFRAKFDRLWDAKSFLSLIGGYYRLMKKWNFNFCQTVASPDLNFLNTNKIHGPIELDSVHKKLPLTKSPGTFLIRRCAEKQNHYIIDLITRQSNRLEIELVHDPCLNVFILHADSSPTRGSTKSLDHLSISKKSEKSNTLEMGYETPVTQEITTPDAIYRVSLNYESYSNLKALIDDLQVWFLDVPGGNPQKPPIQLRYWIYSSEYDYYHLLMSSISRSCIRKSELDQQSIQHSISILPKIIPQKMIDHPKETKHSDNMMLVKFSSLQHQVEVVIKDFNKNAVRSRNHAIFCCSYQKEMKILNLHMTPPQLKLAEWVFLKCPFIASTIGIGLSTSSLIQEHFELGPVDKYIRENNVITGDLIKAVARQLLEALLYLQERQIVHGKIRLHNIFIQQLDPLIVKLTDPLGAIDVSKDRAFIPPEFTSIRGRIYVEEYNTGLDIWAFGTTIWQIYNRGRYPPANQFANTLPQPKSCPDTIWGPLESCWHPYPSERSSSRSVFRDLNDSPIWLNFHEYECISDFGEDEEDEDEDTISDELISKRDSSYQTKPENQSSGVIQESLDEYVCKLPGYQPINNKTGRWMKSLQKSGFNSLEESIANIWHYNVKPHINQEDQSHASKTGLLSSKEGWIINQAKLRLGQELGRGFYGLVRKAFLETEGDYRVVAVKCISSAGCDQETTDDLKREFSILKTLNHPNIVKTLGFVEDVNVMLVVEYMPFGSLSMYIKNRPHSVFLKMPLKKYAIDIAKGMEYLESMKIAHRDLALRNILLASLDEAKICDFGLAQFLDQSGYYEMKTSRALPLRWYAPETLKNQIFTHKSDVWSYGVVLWEIYSGGCNPQYSSSNLIEILKTERLTKPDDCPQDIYDIMSSCWAYEPDRRNSFSEIVRKLDRSK